MKDLIAKILSPTRPYKIKGRVFWIKQNIPYDLQLEAKLIYDKIIDEFRFFGMMRRAELSHILLKTKPLEQELSKLKIRLFERYPDEFLLKTIRAEITSINKEMASIHTEYLTLDMVSLESYAEKISSIFTLSKLGANKRAAEKIYYMQNKNCISLKEIREIARSEYWQNIYSVKPFKYYPLTDEQIVLCNYTKLYSNIAKHPDCPEIEIISDDDLLDGWMLLQNKKVNKKQAPSFGKKIDSSQEVFIMAHGEEHAKKIYEMNSDEARAIQNVRMKQLKKQGAVEFSNLADVKRERLNAR